MGELLNFLSISKNEFGTPKSPFFSKVEGEMRSVAKFGFAFNKVDLSNEKKTWLLRLYRGLYYPVM